jgi:hypothetical protein
MMSREEYEKLEREFEEALASPLPKAKPKPKALITGLVSDQLAEAIKAKPESARLTAEATNGTVVMERPWQDPNTVRVLTERVLEVRNGQPVYDNRAVSDYDIFRALRNDQ